MSAAVSRVLTRATTLIVDRPENAASAPPPAGPDRPIRPVGARHHRGTGSDHQRCSGACPFSTAFLTCSSHCFRKGNSRASRTACRSGGERAPAAENAASGQERPAAPTMQRLHASPPARSASGARLGAIGPSSFAPLYHDKSQATAIMIRMPSNADQDLHPGCRARSRPSRNARQRPGTRPRQKISSECCPHRIAGRSQRDLQRRPVARHEMDRRPPPARGNARSAARRDWSCRSDRSRSSSQRGISGASRGKCQVSVMTNANTR